jgi:tripartite-type tricarboxylate transporter receptor subunit TctC
MAALARPARGHPGRTIRLVIGWPPGGGVDAFGRILAPALAERLGQTVVIENIGGAAGRLGSQAAARAAPDGLTLLLANDTFAATEALPVAGLPAFRNALIPVGQAVEAPNALVTHPASGLADIAAFVAAARDRPGALNLGVPGIGSAQHLTSELALRSIPGGLQVEHVPYRGGGPLLIDLLAGKIDAGIVTFAAAAGQVKDGRLRALAVTTRRRNAAIPEVPSLAETVAPGFHLATWQGLFAPAGTPQAAVQRVQQAMAAALADPALRDRLAGLGFEAASAPAAAFAATVDGTIDRFAAVVRAAGIRGDGA